MHLLGVNAMTEACMDVEFCTLAKYSIVASSSFEMLLWQHLGRAIDARLQTADSSELVYSTISVHRLLHLMVPRFCWLDLRLQLSLYSMYGLPVSTWR